MPPRALIVGINYTGMSHALRGCHADAKRMQQFVESRGFETTVLLDDGQHRAPTRAAILAELARCVGEMQGGDGDRLFFHYSGHGAGIPDVSGDEKDGKDEVLCTADGRIIRDDEMRAVLQRVPEGARVFVLADCCHSGTVLDLPFCAIDRGTIEQENGAVFRCECVSVSGCRDNQTSADAYLGDWDTVSPYGGAMTFSFLKAQGPGSVLALVDRMTGVLAAGAFVQRPQACASHRELLSDEHFLARFFAKKI
jgi:hypothetical protein